MKREWKLRSKRGSSARVGTDAGRKEGRGRADQGVERLVREELEKFRGMMVDDEKKVEYW